jgi:hypothetical protein
VNYVSSIISSYGKNLIQTQSQHSVSEIENKRYISYLEHFPEQIQQTKRLEGGEINKIPIIESTKQEILKNTMNITLDNYTYTINTTGMDNTTCQPECYLNCEMMFPDPTENKYCLINVCKCNIIEKTTIIAKGESKQISKIIFIIKRRY